MTKKEIESKIKELDDQRSIVISRSNQEIGRLTGQMEVYTELLKTAEEK